MTFGELGLLAEERGQPAEATAWTVQCVALFDEFPHPATGPGPHHLARLAGELGLDAVDRAWREATGQPLPTAVLDYIQRKENS